MFNWFVFLWLCANIECAEIAILGPMNLESCEEVREFLSETRFESGEWVLTRCLQLVEEEMV
jgi:hypothetical protein